MPIIQNPITFIYCAVLKGPIFCKEKSADVSKITRSVTDSAKLASDIFESVVGLGNPYNLNMHQADILELAIAVQYSTSLEGKEVLASQLTDLSEMSRDIKDQIIGINSRGINTFSFIAYEFSRLQDLIELIQKGSGEYTTQQVSHNLGILFERISGDLARLLNDIELSIPLTSQAADLGTVITGQLLESYSKLLKIKEDTPLWKKFLEQGSWSQQQLARDLSLTSESASVISLHIADHQLSAEDEVCSMRHIINEFKQAVRDSKVPKKVLKKKLKLEGYTLKQLWTFILQSLDTHIRTHTL
ncbi:hypothetical protein DFH28DRAFT_933534 [Melampsora americana]|nr:hypothetical protein DFH28DRAFT_933534 [Melampsora americana]